MRYLALSWSRLSGIGNRDGQITATYDEPNVGILTLRTVLFSAGPIVRLRYQRAYTANPQCSQMPAYQGNLFALIPYETKAPSETGVYKWGNSTKFPTIHANFLAAACVRHDRILDRLRRCIKNPEQSSLGP